MFEQLWLVLLQHTRGGSGGWSWIQKHDRCAARTVGRACAGGHRVAVCDTKSDKAPSPGR